MIMSNDFQVAKVLKRGLELYKVTLKDAFQYSLITVLLTSFISIYMYFLELIGKVNEVFYAVGLVMLVIVLAPLIYYSIRVVATTVGKLKSLVYKSKYNYKVKFYESKELFWRILLVLFLKFVLGIVVVLMCILIFYSMVGFNIFKTFFIVPMILLLISLLIVSLIMLFKLEFAAPIIYWNIETEYSDVKLSMRITKYYKLKKVFIILIGHLPNLLILLLSLYTSKVYNGFIDIPFLGLISLIATILFSTVAFSWMYSFYTALFEELGAFDPDSDDREWLRY